MSDGNTTLLERGMDIHSIERLQQNLKIADIIVNKYHINVVD